MDYKFNVGDKVEVAKPNGNMSWRAELGEKLVIAEQSHCPYVNDLDGERIGCGSEDCFELVADPAKSKFSLGDHVRIRRRLPGNTTGNVGWNKPDGAVGYTGIVRDDVMGSVEEGDFAQKVCQDNDQGTYLGFFTDEELEFVEEKKNSAFKVGDKVLVPNQSSEVQTIARISDDDFLYPYVLVSRIDAYTNRYSDKELKLAVQEEKASFKVGDRVRVLDSFHTKCVGKVVEIMATAYNAGESYFVTDPCGQWKSGFSINHDQLEFAEPESTTEGIYTGLSGIVDDATSALTIHEIGQHLYGLYHNDKPINKKENKKMAVKHYRTKKELPDLQAGAILSNEHGYYAPITDLWNTKVADDSEDSISWESFVVENATDWFERVYDVKVLGKVKYLVKDAAQKAYAELHKPGKE